MTEPLPIDEALPPPPPLEAFARLDWPTLIARYRSGLTHFHPSLLKVPDEHLDTFFRPEAGVGRWSVRTLLGHLADAEVSFAHDLRHMIAQDAPILPAFDENAYVDARMYEGPDHPVAGFLAVIAAMRNWVGPWLETLPEEASRRVALYPDSGEISVRTMLAFASRHIEHHARFLNLKLRKLEGVGFDAA